MPNSPDCFEERDRLSQAHAFLEGDVLDERGVDVAGSGAHHQTFERGEPHRRRDGSALLDRAGGAPVAEVQGDEVDGLARLAGKLGVALGEIGVRRAVEAVAADAVAAVELVRDRIEIGRFGHCRVKRGIEHRDHRNTFAQQSTSGPNAAQVGRVVQRREVHAVLDPADDVGVDSGVGAEALAAVYDAVTDRVHLAGGIDHPAVVARIVVRPDEPSHHSLDGGAVVADRLGELPGFPVVRPIRAQGLPADAFDDTAREPGLGRGIHELELERRGAAVEDEHVHFDPSRTGRRA